MSDPAEYTVGWICALPVEYVAAQEFLDEEHKKPSFVSPNDTNDYTLGKMHEHNVVIAVLPDGEYGTASAANVATNMLNTFHNVRVGLMVGIGGGVPSEKHDVRLGDVVVSAPRGGEGGVFQYDFGKSIQGQSFQHTRFLNQPPTTLRTAMTGIQAQYKRKGHKLTEAIDIILDTNVRLRSEYERPESTTDRLFRPSVNHKLDCGAESCANDDSNWLPRRERSDHEDNPAIHYGLIASANQLMKNAWVRDRLAAEKDILCFEMEAAGLMNTFPCLVIRGICDYSDSHKSTMWQGYASMVAAAYTKDLLQRIPLNRIEAEERINAVVSEELKGIQHCLDQAYRQNERHFSQQKARVLTDQQRLCHQLFKVVNYAEQKNINPQRADGTCKWAFQSSAYIRWWESNRNELLWVSADPGCGKSVLARSIIDDYSETSHPTVRICYFFFKDNDEQNNLATALCSVLHQLFSQQSSLLTYAIPTWEKNGGALRQEVDELWQILMAATSADISCKTICIFDALDECRETDRRRLIEKLQAFHLQPSSSTEESWLKFLVTSRPYDHIQDHFRAITDYFPHIHVKGEEQNDQIHQEIDLVVRTRVRELAETVPLSPELHHQVERKLLQMEHRTYLWLHLAIGDIRATLKHSLRPGANSITLLPSSVNAAYEKILCQVPVDEIDIVKKIMEIIVAARRPLTIQEMAIALGIATCSKPLTTKQARLDSSNLNEKLRQLCGLFVFTSKSKIYLIHQTAREFLISKGFVRPESMVWQGCVNDQDANRVLSEICVAYLHEEIQKGSCQLPTGAEYCTESDAFLRYSATYWIEHVRSTSGFESRFLRLAGSLCCVKQASVWLRSVEPPFRYCCYAHEPLPFFWAARWGLDDVAYLLLEDSKIQITTEVLEKAAANEPAVMKFLLDRKGDEIRITDSVVQEAAANQESGLAIMTILIERTERRGEELKIVNDVLQNAARNGKSGLAIIKLLVEFLHRGGNKVTITGKVLESAAANWWSGLDIIQYLIDRKDVAVRITRRVLRMVLKHPLGDDILRLLRPRSSLIRRILRKKIPNHTRARLGGNVKWNIRRNKAKLNMKAKQTCRSD